MPCLCELTGREGCGAASTEGRWSGGTIPCPTPHPRTPTSARCPHGHLTQLCGPDAWRALHHSRRLLPIGIGWGVWGWVGGSGGGGVWPSTSPLKRHSLGFGSSLISEQSHHRCLRDPLPNSSMTVSTPRSSWDRQASACKLRSPAAY